MEKARPGASVTHENRGLSNEKVDRAPLYREILAALEKYGPLTARECSYRISGIANRQYTAPRFTELMEKGKVEAYGSKIDEVSRRSVTVYRIREA